MKTPIYIILTLSSLLMGCNTSESGKEGSDSKKINLEIDVSFFSLSQIEESSNMEDYWVLIFNGDTILNNEGSSKWRPRDACLYSTTIRIDDSNQIQIIGQSGKVYLNQNLINKEGEFNSIDTTSEYLFFYGHNLYERYFLSIGNLADYERFKKHMKNGNIAPTNYPRNE